MDHPRHRHNFEETFILLTGEIEATFRGEKTTVLAGETLHIPANAPHSFTNATRMLCLCAPAGQEEFFAQVGVPVATRLTPPPPLDQATRETAAKSSRNLHPSTRPSCSGRKPGSSSILLNQRQSPSRLAPEPITVSWQRTEVKSPSLKRSVPVIAAKDIPYIGHANRFQKLNLYLPDAPLFSPLVGTPVSSLPSLEAASSLPRVHVHVHGGAWRDPLLTSTSIEPTIAHALSDFGASSPITLVASINYTLTQFPTHPSLPYDAIKDNHTDPAREAVHPQHVSDVLHGFALLRSLGLADGSYLLTGHSCGACLVFQSILQPPAHYGLDYLSDAPCPAAILGLNGLYDLPALVDGLGESHASMSADYDRFLSNAFGPDKSRWPAASPGASNRR